MWVFEKRAGNKSFSSDNDPIINLSALLSLLVFKDFPHKGECSKSITVSRLEVDKVPIDLSRWHRKVSSTLSA